MTEIDLGHGYVARIDDEDADLVSRYHWIAAKRVGVTYAVTNIKVDGKRGLLLMHRLLMGAAKGQSVDHLNHDGLDNRRVNIRLCSHSENMRNRKKTAAGKTSSRFKGVSWHKPLNHWRAQIRHEGKKIYLGAYKDEHVAAFAYDSAAVIFHRSYALTNAQLYGDIYDVPQILMSRLPNQWQTYGKAGDVFDGAGPMAHTRHSSE
jgi:hypothetical protein